MTKVIKKKHIELDLTTRCIKQVILLETNQQTNKYIQNSKSYYSIYK